MHVAHFKAGTLARQTTRAQGGNATLVRDFRQRVGLVHELRQLAGTEELFDGSRNRLGVDQIVRPEVFGLGRSEEHTSELQSLMRTSYAVFCLKTKQNHQIKGIK